MKKGEKIIISVCITTIIVILVLVIYNLTFGQANLQENIKKEIYNCAIEYGLDDVSVELSESDFHEVFLYCSNFKSLNWNSVFEMNEKMCAIKGVKGVAYVQEMDENSQSFYLYKDENEIQSFYDGYEIRYSGDWNNETSENMNERMEKQKEVFEQEKDNLIPSHSCIVCEEQATQRIDDEYYCDEHYKDVIEWYLENNK